MLLVVSMVHTYSGAAWEKRRQRAIARGFVRHRSSNNRYMMVEDALFETMKLMYRSIALHCEHDRMTSASHHFARMASYSAHNMGMIDDSQYATATRLHRRAGRAKHEVSKSIVDVSAQRDGEDLVFSADPWKGKVLPKLPEPPEQGDSWAAWLLSRRVGNQNVQDGEYGHDVVDDVAESRGGFDSTVLMDVLMNEVMRALLEMTRAAADAIEHDVGVSLPSGSGEVQDSSVEACPCDDVQHEEVDFQQINEELRQHALVRQRLLQEWELYEFVVRSDAGELRSSLEAGDDEWWSDDLNSAESAEGYARVFDSAEGPVSGADVIAKVVSHFGIEPETAVFHEAGLGTSTVAPAGAWVLLLARVGCHFPYDE